MCFELCVKCLLAYVCLSFHSIEFFLSDFEQLPLDVAVSATIADVEEKKGFIVYFVSSRFYLFFPNKKTFSWCLLMSVLKRFMAG